jgi:hypothetical protein
MLAHGRGVGKQESGQRVEQALPERNVDLGGYVIERESVKRGTLHHFNHMRSD